VRLGLCLVLGLRLGFVLLDVDCAFEEGSVFDHDALGDDVTGEHGRLLEFGAIGGADVAVDAAVNDDLFCLDVGADAAVGANGERMRFQFNAAFDFAVEKEIFAAGEFAADDHGFANVSDIGHFSGYLQTRMDCGCFRSGGNWGHR
jgi:hypothetical protein